MDQILQQRNSVVNLEVWKIGFAVQRKPWG